MIDKTTNLKITIHSMIKPLKREKIKDLISSREFCNFFHFFGKYRFSRFPESDKIERQSFGRRNVRQMSIYEMNNLKRGNIPNGLNLQPEVAALPQRHDIKSI